MNPDVIVLVGDIIEGHSTDDYYQRLSDILRRFRLRWEFGALPVTTNVMPVMNRVYVS